ncbi:DNA-formamidopyrimidine glycosylase family protein [Amycolatopsis magusensis]|uniref:DNA-formamidopyrimidine glycosylase family protein n=1 Tax=Amycolatopsis magusensis TaxID=882444 RepID=UPI003C30680A
MPEGDTVFLAGKRVEKALAGRELLRAEFRHPRLATVDLVGRSVLGVRTVGKHMFLRFSGDLSLHSHLKMDGAWRFLTPGARWPMPAHHARAIFENATALVIGFRLHDLELLATAEESRLVGHLGPDLLDPLWTEEHAARAVANLTADPARELGLALLDQRVLAGVGNMYMVEICHLLRLTPWTPVSEVDAAQVVALARKLLLANAWRHEQSTTGELARGRQNWVYGRTRQGCFRCGGRVRVANQGDGVQRRLSWYCPKCQHGPVPSS